MNTSLRFEDEEDEEDEIIQAQGGACQVGEGDPSHACVPTKAPHEGMHANIDLYDCLYLYTIKTAVNWRQNGQSSHRAYLILAIWPAQSSDSNNGACRSFF